MNHCIATGYNGVPSGFEHCVDTPCPGARSESGKDLDLCEATHAEANSLIQCKNVFEISTAYCTDSPCRHCVKLLLNTSCVRVVFSRLYPHSDSEELWTRRGGKIWTHVRNLGN
jgi:dCMP deaminase